MRKYSYVLQVNTSDCGICALSMIIKYYDGNIPLNIIRNKTHTTKYGTTANNIVDYACGIGLEAHGYHAEYDNLKDINSPFIAHLIMDNKYMHYIVVYEIHNDYLLIGDPAKGLVKMKTKDFLSNWDNIIITFFLKKKLPMIKEINTKEYIKKILLEFKSDLIKLFILSVITTILGIIVSFAFESLIKTNNLLNTYSIFFMIITISALIGYIRNVVLMHFDKKLDTKLTMDTFARIVNLPYCYYEDNMSGDIISRMNDIGSFKEMISNLYLKMILDTLMAIISYIVLVMINAHLAYYALIIFLYYLLVVLIFYPKLSRDISLMQKMKGSVTSFMVESLRGYPTIKGLNLESYVKDEFNLKYQSLLDTYYHYFKTINYQSFFKDLIGHLGDLIIIYIGVRGINNYGIGQLITFHILLTYFLEPIRNVVSSDVSLKEGHNALRRILELTNVPEQEEKDNIPEGNIMINKLTYAYNEGTALHDINLELKQGVNMMLVGPSGSGKSTLFKLILKYYEINNNMIMVNNMDINMYSGNKIRQFITYVSQNETIFSGTIRDNIIFNEKVSNEEYIKVLKVCELNSLLDNKDYQVIEEGGSNLSGGEKERIYLARALLRKAKYLVLDEALGEVDISLERKIIKNIKDNYPDKTLILISHRIDNVDLFDRLIKLENGSIKEDISKPNNYLERRVYG